MREQGALKRASLYIYIHEKGAIKSGSYGVPSASTTTNYIVLETLTGDENGGVRKFVEPSWR